MMELSCQRRQVSSPRDAGATACQMQKPLPLAETQMDGCGSLTTEAKHRFQVKRRPQDNCSLLLLLKS